MQTTFNNISLKQNTIYQQVKGLTRINNFILPSEEKELLDLISGGSWQSEMLRRVQQYGSKYNYFRGFKKFDESVSIIPKWLEEISNRVFETGLLDNFPNQIIINEYLPGQGIAAHVDRVDEFGTTICSLSLGSDCLMQFKNNISGETYDLHLPRLSLVILNEDARYLWTHKIAARKSDKINGVKVQRDRRVSITFRFKFNS